jgi:hypothetical protein
MQFGRFAPPLPFDSPDGFPLQGQFLSPDEFESLNKAVQLLRISQLRYLVQKFEIPASGNKSKLLNLVLSIFQSLRFDKVLIEIHHEITRLLSQHEDPFSNPIASVSALSIVGHDPNFFSPPNPLICEGSDFLLGPLLANAGQFAGRFHFTCPVKCGVVVGFLFQGGVVHRFALKVEVNGFLFEISGDDPFPERLDVGHVVNFGGGRNVMEVKMLATVEPMMIVVREYEFVGIGKCVNAIVGRAVDLRTERVLVRHAGCEHSQGVDFVMLLTVGLATGRMTCPNCHREVDIGRLVPEPEARPAKAEIYQPAIAEMIESQVDWFDF